MRFLAQATSVVDGVDGKLARLQLPGSPRNALLDGVLDRLADGAILTGLGVWGLPDGLPATWTVALVAAAITTALLSMATKDRIVALSVAQVPSNAPVICFAVGTAASCWSRSSLSSGSQKPPLSRLPSPSGLGARLRVWCV